MQIWNLICKQIKLVVEYAICLKEVSLYIESEAEELKEAPILKVAFYKYLKKVNIRTQYMHAIAEILVLVFRNCSFLVFFNSLY